MKKSKFPISSKEYEFFKDRLAAVSLIMEGILQQHPVAKIEPQVKEHISAAVDELYKANTYITENC